MSRLYALAIVIVGASLGSGCSNTPDSPTAPSAAAASGTAAAAARRPVTAQSWGPETPNFNLEVILRGDGFGHVKFRQPNDDELVVYLGTWVRGLAPNTSYQLQRAVDTVVDDDCTSTAWLTLGKGLQPQSIVTDGRGTARESLFRSLAAFSPGSEFDIHFRVIREGTSVAVLTSECYQFTISQ